MKIGTTQTKSLELAVLRFQAQCTHKLAKLIVYMYAL